MRKITSVNPLYIIINEADGSIIKEKRKQILNFYRYR